MTDPVRIDAADSPIINVQWDHAIKLVAASLIAITSLMLKAWSSCLNCSVLKRSNYSDCAVDTKLCVLHSDSSGRLCRSSRTICTLNKPLNLSSPAGKKHRLSWLPWWSPLWTSHSFKFKPPCPSFYDLVLVCRSLKLDRHLWHAPMVSRQVVCQLAICSLGKLCYRSWTWF